MAATLKDLHLPLYVSFFCVKEVLYIYRLQNKQYYKAAEHGQCSG